MARNWNQRKARPLDGRRACDVCQSIYDRQELPIFDGVLGRAIIICWSISTVSDGGVESADRRNSLGECIGETGGRRRGFLEVAADAIICWAEDGIFRDCIADIESAHVLMSTYGLLHVADVHDVGRAVGALLPSACAYEEDGDEGE